MTACALLPGTAFAAGGPVATASVSPPSTGWFNGAQVCVNASAADTGSTVTRLSLVNPSGTELASFTPATPAASVQHALCVPTTALSQGVQTLRVLANDSAGLTSPAAPVTVQVDTQAPRVVTVGPDPDSSISDPQPSIYVIFDNGASGIASASATLDGSQKFAFGKFASSSVLNLIVPGDLDLGWHVVWYTATDGAGNTTSGSFSFSIAGVDPNPIDTQGPAVSAAGPLFASTVGSSQSCATVSAADPAGVASLELVDEKGNVVSAYTVPGAPFSVSHDLCMSPTTTGQHTVHVVAADTYGNTTDLAKTISVDIPTVTLHRAWFGNTLVYLIEFTVDTGDLTAVSVALDHGAAQNGDPTQGGYYTGGIADYTMNGQFGNVLPGTHTLTWTAKTRRGVSSQGTITFAYGS